MASDDEPIRLSAGAYFGHRRAVLSTPRFHLLESHYRDREYVPLHAHENAHFCFVADGAYTERLESHRLERRTGDLIFYPPAQAHAEVHHNRNRHFLIDVAPELLRLADEARIPIDQAQQLTCRRSRNLVARLYREFSQPDAVTLLTAEALLLELLTLLGRQRDVRPGARTSWLRVVEDALQAHFAESIGLEDVAAIAGVHPVYLARVFRREHGCSVGEYVRRFRIEAACRELERGTTSIARIALQTGFADQSHFHRTFKRATGMTPSQFRERFADPGCKRSIRTRS